MIWINNLLADFEAHRSTSIEFEKSDCAARAGLGENPSDAVKRRALFGKCFESSNWSCKASSDSQLKFSK
jgi:hypothetical protein